MFDESQPIFTCVCPEPEGTITRSVYPMPLTPQNMKLFWEKARIFKTLFTRELNDSFQEFAETLISRHGEELSSNGLYWRIDDFVGIFYMTDITDIDAQIHYTFFDRRHRGRHELVKMMLRYVFEKYGLHRLTAEIPYFASKKEDKDESPLNQGVFNFIQSVGLKPEGRKREAALYNNDYFDVQIFGILKREAEKCHPNQKQLAEVELDLDKISPASLSKV